MSAQKFFGEAAGGSAIISSFMTDAAKVFVVVGRFDFPLKTEPTLGIRQKTHQTLDFAQRF